MARAAEDSSKKQDGRHTDEKPGDWPEPDRVNPHRVAPTAGACVLPTKRSSEVEMSPIGAIDR